MFLLSLGLFLLALGMLGMAWKLRGPISFAVLLYMLWNGLL